MLFHYRVRTVCWKFAPNDATSNANSPGAVVVVISMLALYSDDLSSNPAEFYSFIGKFVWKEAGECPS